MTHCKLSTELLPASHIGRERGEAARYTTPTHDECSSSISRTLEWDNPVLWRQGGSDLAPTPILVEAARAFAQLEAYLGRCIAYAELGDGPTYVSQIRAEYVRLGRVITAIEKQAVKA